MYLSKRNLFFRAVAVAANVELLMDGNLISLTCNLADPLYERGTIVASEAESVGLHPAGLSDDAGDLTQNNKMCLLN